MDVKHGAVYTVCAHTFTLFWLRKTSVIIETFQVSSMCLCVPFVQRSLYFRLSQVTQFIPWACRGPWYGSCPRITTFTLEMGHACVHVHTWSSGGYTMWEDLSFTRNWLSWEQDTDVLSTLISHYNYYIHFTIQKLSHLLEWPVPPGPSCTCHWKASAKNSSKWISKWPIRNSNFCVLQQTPLEML